MTQEHKHENPYVGPRTFTRKESSRFFGREREARDLFSLVMSERLVLFYAQSGAGKSSIIQTRLVPELEASNYLVLPVGRVSGELPQGISEVDNIYAFNLMLSLDQSHGDPNTLAHLPLSEFLSKLTSEDSKTFFYDVSATPVKDQEDYGESFYVLIVDQFEEIISAHQERWQEREEFFRQLNEAMKNDPLLWVVLTLREDYVAALDPYAPLLTDKMRGRFYMKRMGVSSALEAVQKPAQLYGRPFAPGVAEILVDNLRQIRSHGAKETSVGEFIEPVQLQVVCYQLWENLRGHPQAEITQQDLDELGDVDTALSQFYEDALAKVMQATHVSEIAIRTWFDKQLITEAGTRGTVYQGSEETAGMNNNVVNLLASQFLLRGEIRAGGTWYELVHDRFVNPILEANQAWRLRQNPLIQAAEAWNRAGRDRKLLYKDEQLKQLLTAIDREAQEPIVQEFLQASEEAQSQRDLVSAQAQAEEERQRAEDEALAARRLRRLSVALVFVFILAMIAAVFAFRERGTAVAAQVTAEAASTVAVQERDNAAIERDRANENEAAAVTQEAAAIIAEVTAEAASTVAVQERDNAAIERDRANQEAQIAATQEALAVAAESRASEAQQVSQAQLVAALAPLIVERSNDTELATLLAIEAYHLNNEVEGNARVLIDSALRQILSRPFFNTKLVGHEGAINRVEYSPDNNFLVTASDDATIRIWDLNDPRNPPRVLQGHTEAVLSLAFSGDGRWLASASADDTVRLWDYAISDTAVSTLPHNADVSAVAFRPGRDELVSGDVNGTLTIWNIADPANPEILSSATNHEAPIFAVLYLDANNIIAASREAIKWHSANNLENSPLSLGTIKGFTGDIALSNGQQFLAVATEDDQGVQVFDISQTNPTVVANIVGHSGQIRDLTFTQENQFTTLITVGDDRTTRFWQFDGNNFFLRDTLRGHQDNILSVAAAPHGRFIVTASKDQTIRQWDLMPPIAAPTILTDHESSVQAVVYGSTDEGNLLISASANNSRVIIHNSNGDELSRVIHGEIINGVALSNDSSILAVAGGNTVKLWNVANPRSPIPMNDLVHDSDVYALAFSPANNGRLAAGDDNGTIYVWDISSPSAPIARESGHNGRVWSIAYHPAASRLVTGGEDHSLRLWNVENDALTMEAVEEDKHEGAVRAVAYSPDGNILASAGEDKTIRLWDGSDLASFSPYPDMATLIGHEEAITTLAFNPSSPTLASGSRDQTIRLWNLNKLNNAPIVLTGHSNEITALAYSPDGQQLASASVDQSVRVQVATVDSLVQIGCQQVRRILTEAEWTAYLPLRAYQPSACINP